jgi:hypothetical protein
MAKGRKPAIGGLARPEGFLDDVVRPVVQKAARKVMSKTLKSGEPSIGQNLYYGAAKVERKMAAKRAAGYAKSGRKGYAKMENAIERKYAEGMGSARNSKKIDAGAQKYVVNQKKEEALKRGASVRKAAKDYRKKYPKK